MEKYNKYYIGKSIPGTIAKTGSLAVVYERANQTKFKGEKIYEYF